MRRINIAENFKNCIASKPPTVLFVVCLISFIIVLSSLMDYILRHEIKNPDELDWNTFREHMAGLEYCVKYPTKAEDRIIDEKSKTDKTTDRKSVETMLKEDKIPKKNSFSYELTFSIDYPGNITELEALSYINGYIDGFLIGVQKEPIDMSFRILEYSPSYDEGCTKRLLQGKKCFRYLVKGCVTLTGLSTVFPKTKAPQICSKVKSKDPKKGSLITTTFTAYKETPELTHQYWCPSTHGIIAVIKNNEFDPKLIPLLNFKDKELIIKNLTYVLIGLSITITLLVVISVAGTSRKKNSYYSQVSVY